MHFGRFLHFSQKVVGVTLISPDPYALRIPKISHFSRFVEFFLLEYFFKNKAKKLNSDLFTFFTRKQIGHN